MSSKIFQRKRRTLLAFMIISVCFFILAIATVAPGRKLLHKEYVELDINDGVTRWNYNIPEEDYIGYKIKVTYLDNEIIITVTQTSMSYDYLLEPFSDSLSFGDSITHLRIESNLASFQIRVIGIRYPTSPILITFGTIYGIILIITIIVMRLPLSEEKPIKEHVISSKNENY